MITSLAEYGLDPIPEGVESRKRIRPAIAPVADQIQFERTEEQYELKAAGRICGALRKYFDGTFYSRIPTTSNAPLQDALDVWANRLLRFIDNDDKALGDNPKTVARRVLAGLKLLACKKGRAGKMRLVGEFDSLTGRFIVRLVEGLKLRKRRKSLSADFYPEMKRRECRIAAEKQRKLQRARAA